jgi:hypothetical protein
VTNLDPAEQVCQQQHGRKLLVLFWIERSYVIDDESGKTTDEVGVPERTDHAATSAYNSKYFVVTGRITIEGQRTSTNK